MLQNKIKTKLKETFGNLKKIMHCTLVVATLAISLSAVTLLQKSSTALNVDAAAVCPNGSYFNTNDSLCHQDIGFAGNKCFNFTLPDASNNCSSSTSGLYNCASSDANVLMYGGDSNICAQSPYFKAGRCFAKTFNNPNNLQANEDNLDAIMAYLNVTTPNGNARVNNDNICDTSGLKSDGFSNPQTLSVSGTFQNASPCPAGFRVFMDGSSPFHTLAAGGFAGTNRYVTQFICIDKNFADGVTFKSDPIYNSVRVVHSGTQYDGDPSNIAQGCSEYAGGNYSNMGRVYQVIANGGQNLSGSQRTFLCVKQSYQASIPYCQAGFNTYFSATFNGCVRTFAATSFSCPAGQYLSNPATNSCTICTPGSFCDGGLGAVKVACVGGTYCPAGSSYPTDCPAGSFCGASVSIPAICLPNTYCPQNSITATNCPVGTVSNTESSYLSDCTPTSCQSGETLTVGVCARNPGLYTDVKYSTTANGSESSAITTAPGSTVYQRIYYENTGTDAVNEASIKTTLPAGFTYVPGSFTHCKIPTLNEKFCDDKNATERDDMLSTMLNTGLSPASTFYDGSDTGANGTATLSAKGILDAGKKRFINIENCYYDDANLAKEFNLALKGSNDSFGSNKTTASNELVTYGCRAGTAANPYLNSFYSSYDMSDYKNFYLAQCKATSPTEGKFISWFGGTGKVDAQSGVSDSETYPYAVSGSPCVTNGDYANVAADSGVQKSVLLGNRYLNMSQCFYNDATFNRITNLIDSTPNSTNPYNFKANTFGSDTPITALDCGIGGNGYSRNTGFSTFKAIDMLDTSRSKGYFEFKMLVPTTGVQPIYPQAATITAKDSTGADITPVATNGTINVTITPTLGTTPTSAVTGVIGSALPTIALVGSNIPDNTVAIFQLPYVGATSVLSGKIIGGNFVPDAPAIIIPGTLTGAQTGTLTIYGPSGSSSGIAPLLINTNFSAAVSSSSSVVSSSSVITSSSVVTSSSSSTAISSSSAPSNVTTLNLKVLLSGNYDSSTNLMKTVLRSSNLIPALQPYTSAPFNYAGTETTTPASLPANAVDWVLIEIKNSTGSIVQQKAGLLMSSGSVVDASPTGSGISDLLKLPNVTTTGDYKIIVRHRNHLAIATNTNVTLTNNSTTTVDLTGNVNVKNSNQLSIGTAGKFGMRMANVNGNSEIDSADRAISRNSSELINSYRSEDVNLDGVIDSLDRTLTRLAQEAIESL
jgi:uncharacterized repeat protein (TIGR01451 family)